MNHFDVYEDGRECWFPDAEDFIYQQFEDDLEQFRQGYFEECILQDSGAATSSYRQNVL